MRRSSHQPRSWSRCRIHRHRRGSAYVMVLVTAMIIAGIGISAIAMTRAQTRSTSRANDWGQAQMLAISGVEHALAVLNTEAKWRSVLQHDVTARSENIGRGGFSWKLLDRTDTLLSDDATDGISIVATGTVGQAQYSLSVSVDSVGGILQIDQDTWARVVD